jgi:hypothetical protein
VELHRGDQSFSASPGTELTVSAGETVYADATLARDVSGIILHGSIEGLSPRDALDVALRTSGLVHRLRDGELLVLKPSSPP